MLSILRSFTRSAEANVIMITAGAMFLTFIVVGGAVDLTRYVLIRTQAQAALDHSLLAAAAVKNTQDYTAVGRRFFHANFNTTIGTPTDPVYQNAEDGRALTGTVDVFIPAYFGSFIGIDDYRYRAYAEAIADDSAVEIVMAIDNSPSMCRTSPFGGLETIDESCTKFNTAKTAAQRLVEVVGNANVPDLSIGVVPFNHNVNFGNGSGSHPSMGPSASGNGGPTPYLSNVLAPSRNLQAVSNHISQMPIEARSWGFTRTNIGTTVAAMSVMPFAPERRHFTHEANLPGLFNPRLRDKILVIMTDGENTTSFVPPARGSYIAVPNPADDTHQEELCTYLKREFGILIYTITFDMADGPQKTIMRNCASFPNFYYDVSGGNLSDLVDAYEEIAESIIQVRLSR